MSTHDAFAAVAREPFIPDTIYVRSPETGWVTPLRRSESPDRWHTHVHQDAPVVTAVAPDPRAPEHILDPATGRGYTAVSSSTDPRLMARMIDALELAPGMRVLEIGTGTGWTAALLAYLVGVEKVVSIEVDAAVAERARRALDEVGYPVRVVTGDGAEGYPGEAPYDRVIATAAIQDLPETWVEQTRPGGRIVVPWASTVHADSPLGVVTVTAEGRGEEWFLGPAPFMPLRTSSGWP